MSLSNYEIGIRIQDLRRAKGLTQEELAEAVGFSAVSIAKVEAGIRGCSLERLVALADFFDTSLDYLVLGRATQKDIRHEIDATIKSLTELRRKL